MKWEEGEGWKGGKDGRVEEGEGWKDGMTETEFSRKNSVSLHHKIKVDETLARKILMRKLD